MKALKSMRLHIGIFGKTNAGKSAFLNRITNQDVSIVSDIAGTTTDVVEKSMELLPVGPVVFLDTAGINDSTELAGERIEKTMKVINRTDVAVIICDYNGIDDYEMNLIKKFEELQIPYMVVVNKSDIQEIPDDKYKKIVEKVRNRVPDVTITSDFIAGFPSETEEQFVETLTAIDEFELDYCNVAAYSPREKTVAAKWTDKFIPEDIKNERFQRLNKKIQENCLKSNLKYTGREMEVLVESFYEHKGQMINSGKTRNFKTVHIPCNKDLTGQFVNAKITGVKTWYLKGELNKEDKK